MIQTHQKKLVQADPQRLDFRSSGGSSKLTLQGEGGEDVVWVAVVGAGCLFGLRIWGWTWWAEGWHGEETGEVEEPDTEAGMRQHSEACHLRVGYMEHVHLKMSKDV